MIQIDNFIDDKDSDLIEELLFSNKFPWFHIKETVDTLDNIVTEEFVTTPVFRHVFVLDWEINSSFAGYVKPLATKIESLFDNKVVWFSMTANLLPPDQNHIGKMCYPHIDMNYESKIYSEHDCYTGIYYVHDIDGETVLFNEMHDGGRTIKKYDEFTIKQKISPKKNRIAYWETNNFHSAPASAMETRCVINLNFLVKKTEKVKDGRKE